MADAVRCLEWAGDRWVLPVEGQRVTRLCIDYAVTLRLANDLSFRMEQPFVFTLSEDRERLVVPDGDVERLAAVVNLARATVEKGAAFEDGHLKWIDSNATQRNQECTLPVVYSPTARRHRFCGKNRTTGRLVRSEQYRSVQSPTACDHGSHRSAQLEVYTMSPDKPRREPMTAAELMAELAQDPEHVAQQSANERELAAREDEYRIAEAPVIDDLRSTGLEVTSVWDLVNTSEPYPSAVTILLDHVQRDYPARVRVGIARALAVPDAAFGWPVLQREYIAAREEDSKDGLAAALSATATMSTLDDLIELVHNPQHGDSRLLLLPGLKRLNHPRARATLEALTSDMELGAEARRLLKARG